MPWPLAAVVGIFLTCAISVFTLELQPGAIETLLKGLWSHKVFLILNCWPIAATMLLCVFVLRNVFFSGAVTGFVWMGLSYVNTIKMSGRGDPFVPGDMMLLLEGMDAAGSYSMDMQLTKLAFICCFAVLLVALGFVFPARRMGWPVRSLGALVTLGAFAVTMATAYPDTKIYNSYEKLNTGNVPVVFNTLGFPYCFLHNFNLYPVDKPTGYSERDAAGFAAEYGRTPETPEEMPNIVMIMCEAFCDIPNWEPFAYSPEENPIAPYNALAALPTTVAGHMVVSNIGAGTANTEFDILTGFMTNRLSPNTSSALRVIHRNTPSLAYMLESVGYHPFFTHPGQAWFYNRESAFSFLGIKDSEFEEVYEGMERKGGTRVSDGAFLERLREQLETRSGTPIFAYGTTKENHQAYYYGKYAYDVPPTRSTVTFSEKAEENLAVYFEGLRDSANMLQGLTEYLDTRQEPYILVFFGDHQPALGADFLSYEEMGRHYIQPQTTEERLSMYEVPFLVWANAAYLADHDLASDAAALGMTDGALISDHYLGAFVTELAGIRGADPYFDYLNEMRLRLPVDSIYGCTLPDGTCTDTLPEDLEAMEETRWQWQYYRLKTEKAGK